MKWSNSKDWSNGSIPGNWCRVSWNYISLLLERNPLQQILLYYFTSPCALCSILYNHSESISLFPWGRPMSSQTWYLRSLNVVIFICIACLHTSDLHALLYYLGSSLGKEHTKAIKLVSYLSGAFFNLELLLNPLLPSLLCSMCAISICIFHQLLHSFRLPIPYQQALC